MADPDPIKRKQFASEGGHARARIGRLRDRVTNELAEDVAAKADEADLTLVHRARIAARLLAGAA